MVSVSCVSEPSNTDAKQDLQTKFYGLWHYPRNDIYYTISKDTLVAYMPEDDTGFTARISKWEHIKNKGNNSEEFPEGFIITAKIEKMKGAWWISIGETDTWTWFLNKDQASLVTDTGVKYLFVTEPVI